jgi:hypothetical protein
MTAVVACYALGIAVALWRTDAAWPARLGLALLWPIGPLAFLVTVSALIAAACIAFPLLGAAVLGAGILWWGLVA